MHAIIGMHMRGTRLRLLCVLSLCVLSVWFISTSPSIDLYILIFIFLDFIIFISFLF